MMRFEWDPRKAAANKAKHGIPFEEALHVLYDPWAIFLPDPEHSGMERREKVLGECAAGLVVVIFVEPQADLYRIISARQATQRERTDYAQGRWI